MAEFRSFTPEQDSNTESRILSDADLIRGGAEIKGGSLAPTGEQLDRMKQEMDRDLYLTTDEGQAEMKSAEKGELFFSLLTKKRETRFLSPSEQENLLLTLNRLGFRIREGDDHNSQIDHISSLATEHRDIFFGMFKQLGGFSLNNQVIRVKRSSGEVEDGWKIDHLNQTPGDKAEGYVKVINSDGNLYKHIPLYEVAFTNKELFN